MVRHECSKCPKTFAFKSGLSRHVTGTHTDAFKRADQRYCFTCRKSFTSVWYLKDHMKSHMDPAERTLACPQCGRGYLTTKSLERHVMVAHQGDTSTMQACSYCDKKFSTPAALERHVTTHTGERPFVCPECNREFAEKGSMESHMSRMHGEALYACPDPTCGKQFRDKRVLKEHLPTHDEGRRKYPCTTCGKCYTAKQVLRHHMKLAHEGGELKYSCTFCGKKFSESYLAAHVRSHTGEKPYKCLTCPAKFSTAGGRSQHRRFMYQSNGVRPLKGSTCASTSTDRQRLACPSCSCTFLSKSGWKVHVKFKHEGQELPHNCGFCEKKFSTSTQLIVHQRRHTGERPYTCTTCGNRFSQRGSLRVHLETHKNKTERPLLGCTQCDKKLTTKTRLQRHMALHGMRKECRICGETFDKIGGNSLRQHMKLHTGRN